MSKLASLIANAKAAQVRSQEIEPGRLVRLLGIAKAAPQEPTVAIKEGALTKLLDAADAEYNPHAYAEIYRICGLPVVDGYPKEERERYCRENIDARFFDRGFRLHDCQVDSVLAYKRYGNLFAPIGVGWGKTAVTVIIAGEGYGAGILRSVLLVPPQVVSQLWHTDIAWCRERFNLHGVPFFLCTGTRAQRRAVASSGKLGCYILPYSMLSTEDAEEIIQLIKPQLVICDEAHNIKARLSARTKRIMKYVEKDKPQFVALSGTITSKSVLDYHHLVAPLGPNCPLPMKRELAWEWSQVLDSGAEVNKYNVGPIRPLVDWVRRQPTAPDCPPTAAGFRRAYRYRLQTAPCTVATGDNEIGTSLTLANDPVSREDCEATEGWAALKKHIEVLETEWATPDGDEIEHAIHKYKWSHELASGFYNSLVWPAAEVLADRRGVSVRAAAESLEKAREHHAALQSYHKILRDWLKNHPHKTGLDTPMLVARSISQHGAKEVKSNELADSWLAQARLRFPGMPERDSVVRRVCPFKVNRAIEWADSHRDGGGIIWYHHQGIGDWIAERARATNVPITHCPAGREFDRIIAASQGQVVAASISAHGTGKNLQFHQSQLVVEFPRPPIAAEQMLGRTHRYGQDADEITVDTLVQPNALAATGVAQVGVFAEPGFEELKFAAMLNDALYIQQTTGARQKVIYCNYDPQPKVISSEVLYERGMQNNLLTKEQQAMLNERFGVK